MNTQTRTVSEPVYFQRLSPATCEGLKAGDKLHVWTDGARKPAVYTVDGVGEKTQIVGVVGTRGGKAYLITNVHSGFVSLVAGIVCKGYVARIEKI